MFFVLKLRFFSFLNQGSETVIGLRFWPGGEEIEITNKNAFKGMKNLQFLTIDSYSKSLLCLPEGLNCLPNKLRFLNWPYCPMRFWPSKFSGKFLVELCLKESKLEKLWEGIEVSSCHFCCIVLCLVLKARLVISLKRCQTVFFSVCIAAPMSQGDEIEWLQGSERDSRSLRSH